MSTNHNAVFTGGTINLEAFDLGEGPVFVDLDANTAGALTPENGPSQTGFLRIGEDEIALEDVENIIGTDLGERLFGSEEDGFILAGVGDDLLIGGKDDDTLTGGEGADRFVFRGRFDDDVVTDLNFAEGDEMKISGSRRIDSEADLIVYAERLNEDNRQNTSATIEGDDLLLDVKGSEILLIGAAAGWGDDLISA